MLYNILFRAKLHENLLRSSGNQFICLKHFLVLLKFVRGSNIKLSSILHRRYRIASSSVQILYVHTNKGDWIFQVFTVFFKLFKKSSLAQYELYFNYFLCVL